MNRQWKLHIDGYNHTVVFKSNKLTGRKQLFVDNNEVILENKLFQDLLGIDIPIMIGDKECRFVIANGKADVVVEGIYFDSKFTYTPLKPMPRWNWLFIILCFLIPVISLGGVLPMVIALVGSLICSRISMSQKLNTISSIICCIGIVIVCWCLWILLIILMASV